MGAPCWIDELEFACKSGLWLGGVVVFVVVLLFAVDWLSRWRFRR